MKCPFCNHIEDKVVDSRESREGDAIPAPAVFGLRTAIHDL